MTDEKITVISYVIVNVETAPQHITATVNCKNCQKISFL